MSVSENTTSSLIPLESLTLADQALEFCRSITDIQIGNNEQAENANRLFREIGGHINTLEAERKRLKEPYLQSGKKIDDFFKETSLPLLNAKSKLDTSIRRYQKELEAKRIAEQQRLNREAEEKRRIAEEAARKEREKAEAYRQQGRDALAEKAEARAEVKEEKAAEVCAPIAVVATPMLAGSTTRSNWKMEINDPIEFVRWAVETNQYHLLAPNTTTCTAHAKTIRQKILYEWGRIYNDEKLTGRAI